MQYALLIYGDESAMAGMSEADMKAVMDEWWKYDAWLQEKGWNAGGEALQDTSQATTVRVRDGETVTTDGPFAETKEQFGGYYLLNCDNLDDAIEAAARCPGALNGTIELRPVVDFSQEQGA